MNTLLNPESLSETINLVNDALLAGIPIMESEKIAVSKWIASRQGAPNSYAGMPAPTSEELSKPIKRYTGEVITSKASLTHILGEEACRVLLLLGVKEKSVTTALSRATEGMLAAIERQKAQNPDRAGTYCCGGCTPAYWRHLAAGGLNRQEQEIEAGLRVLKAHRTVDGTWRRFPVAWTIAALVDIGKPAREELLYVAKTLETYCKVNETNDIYRLRRKRIAERACALL